MLTEGPMIDVDALVVRRGARVVLRDVTLSVGRGEFLAVAGPNGAGKTTLLQCLLGLLAAAAGGVRLLGRSLERYPRRELARLMGYVPQADGRPVSFTAEEFVLLGRYPHWSRFQAVSVEDRRVVGEAMELTGTAAFAGRPLASLSGGERQKVFIAAALAQEARILLLDEPTAFLDPRHQTEIAALLRRLNRERGVTVVMVTHDVNMGAFCSDRVLALRDGATSYLGPARGFLRADVLETLYGVPFDVVGPASGRTWAAPRVGP